MERKSDLDHLRIAAAFAVVLFHVLGSAVHNDPTVSTDLQLSAARWKAMLGWPVPVFFMITGFLQLHPKRECTYRKVWGSLRRFGLVLFTVGFAYALMERVFVAGTLSARLLLLTLGDVFSGRLWDHMWYLYAAIGVYLALPVIRPFFDTQAPGSIRLATALLWLFTVLAPALEDACGYVLPVKLPLAEPLFYVFAGGALARLHIPHRTGWLAGAGFVLCCLLLYGNALGALSPLLTSLAALLIFVFFAGALAGRPSTAAVRSMAECTFGVYLFQQFFINVMIKVLHIYPLRFAPVPGVVLSALCVFVLSFLAALLLRRIRWVRNRLL